MSRKGQGSRPGGGQSGWNREQRKQERVGRGQGGGGGSQGRGSRGAECPGGFSGRCGAGVRIDWAGRWRQCEAASVIPAEGMGTGYPPHPWKRSHEEGLEGEARGSVAGLGVARAASTEAVRFWLLSRKVESGVPRGSPRAARESRGRGCLWLGSRGGGGTAAGCVSHSWS